MIIVFLYLQEPLNSEDDVSEEDPTDMFDTDNVVVCQYDKVCLNCVKFYFPSSRGAITVLC